MIIVFLVDVFPSISETFILNQITGLIDLGHEVYIFSAARSQEHLFHDDVRKYDLLKRTYYHNEKPGNKFKRIFWAMVMILAYGHRNPKAILNSLNFFRYGRQALSLTYLYKVTLFLGIEKAQIIFAHYGHNGNLGALMKELGIEAKLLTMFHGYDIRRGEETKGLYKPLFKLGDGFLSISDYNYRHLVDFGAPIDKIHNHPVGIDIKRFGSMPARPLMEGMPVRILTVGRLVEEKGLAYGIEAVHELVHKRGLPHVEYYILGDGPLRRQLQDLAERLDVKSKVFFLGYQTQEGVERLLMQSHMFLLPSVAEALPVVLMEAQAAGLPVVAANVGSVQQVMIDGVSGFIVPAGDITAMAGRLEYLARHPELWVQMGGAGRSHIAKYYDIQSLNQELSLLFEQSLKT